MMYIFTIVTYMELLNPCPGGHKYTFFFKIPCIGHHYDTFSLSGCREEDSLRKNTFG